MTARTNSGLSRFPAKESPTNRPRKPRDQTCKQNNFPCTFRLPLHPKPGDSPKQTSSQALRTTVASIAAPSGQATAMSSTSAGRTIAARKEATRPHTPVRNQTRLDRCRRKILARCRSRRALLQAQTGMAAQKPTLLEGSETEENCQMP